MVEGHSVHRVAADQRKLFVGKKFKAWSPNKRFQDEAKLISNKKYEKIVPIGKNLFAFFEGGHVMHVHFGMSGRWSIFTKNKNPPPPKSTTRLILESKDGLVSHLSAMTVRLGDHTFFEEKKRKLGEDPLSENPDVDDLFLRVSKSKKTISKLLMDQGFFAGVGNIYRAEILFVSKTNPSLKGVNMTREQFDRVWNASVSLMQSGFQTGRISSMTQKEAKKLGDPYRRRYVYNQSKCLICKGRIQSFSESSRTVWFCSHCQSGEETPSLSSSSSVFHSKCASEPLVSRKSNPMKLTVKELRLEIEKHGIEIPKHGARKSMLVKVLSDYLQDLNEHTADFVDSKIAVHGYNRRLAASSFFYCNAKKISRKEKKKGENED